MIEIMLIISVCWIVAFIALSYYFMIKSDRLTLNNIKKKARIGRLKKDKLLLQFDKNQMKCINRMSAKKFNEFNDSIKE